MRVCLLDAGIVAPGFPRWDDAVPILRGDRPYQDAALAVPPPVMLSPNERRRATLATRIALEAARQASCGDTAGQEELLSVFASADGDMGLIDSMCRAIYEHHSPPSPTVFQNSVHNAVAGYWSLGASCRQASNSVAAGNGSFAAGLLEAATMVTTENIPALLVAFDVPAPALLHPHRTFGCAFACALQLAPAETAGTHPRLTLTLRSTDDAGAESTLGTPALEAMRSGNPAARALPLLSAIAAAAPARVRLPFWPDLFLAVDLEGGG